MLAVISLCLSIAALAITLGTQYYITKVKNTDKPQAIGNLNQIVSIDNLTGSSDTSAAQDHILKWQKQLEVTPTESDVTATVYEKILSGQDYQPGSLQLPQGWEALYTTDVVSDPSQATYTESEPSSGVTYIKISTSTVTTTYPVSQAALTQPLDQEVIESPTGVNTVAAKEYNNKVFIIYKSIDVNDGVNDSTDLTIGCLDLKTYKTCNEGGVTFPTYMSSSSGTKLGAAGTPKDISTPMSMQQGFDDGTYGHAGYLYIPAQQGDNYGVNCVNLVALENCGFTTLGSTAAPSQAATRNPALITGFAQNGSKLYGHANYNNDNSSKLDDFLQITCFDMTTQASCSDYTAGSNSTAPSLYLAEHAYQFYTPGQNVMIGDKYYFLMNYDQAATIVDASIYSQSTFGNRLICYDTVSKTACSGFATGYVSYKCVIFVGCTYMTIPGALVSESAFGTEVPHQLMLSKNTDGSIKGICAVIGLASGVDPNTVCYNPSTGALDSSAKPPGFLPTQWLNIPWSPGFGVTPITNGATDKIFSSMQLPADNIWGGRKKAAMICYDWKTQAPCAGFRFPHYWYEIDQADSLDASYIEDGNCMIGVSGYNYLWSFDSATGETPCRNTEHEVALDPTATIQESYCDGQTRNLSWARLQLNDVNLHDFKSLDITIKDKNGSTLGSFNNVDIKNVERLDLSTIPFSGDTDSLIVEATGVAWNTSPWGLVGDPQLGIKNLPQVSIVLTGEPVQYCYHTKVKPLCNIAAVSTNSAITVQAQANSTSDSVTTTLPVTQEPEVQCFKSLDIVSTADVTNVSPGDNITYTINVENLANTNNDGLGIVNDAVVEATIPSGTSLVSASAGGTQQSNKIVWPTSTITPKQTSDHTVTVRVDSPAALQSRPRIINTAKAAGETPIVFTANVSYNNDSDQSTTINTSNNSVLVTSQSTPSPTPSSTPSADPSYEQGSDSTNKSLLNSIPRVGIALAAIFIPILLASIITIGYIYIDYRRHKKPLRDVKPDVRYTISHHIKFVVWPRWMYHLRRK